LFVIAPQVSIKRNFVKAARIALSDKRSWDGPSWTNILFTF
jgi:hypothetical protein